MSDDSPGIERYMNAAEVIPNSEIQLTLEKCPLFKGVSLQTLNTILSRIQAVKADFGARLIGKSLLNRGLLIAKQLSSIRVIPSDTDDYFNQVAEVNIFAGAYLGEFLFTDTGLRGSANIINTTQDSLYLFIPKDVFTDLPERAKVEILLNILRMPLLS